jgi:hypothetical protein
MDETKQDNDEKISYKTYIKKGFLISLGAASGIGLIGASIIGISELPTFIGNIPVAYKVLTQKDSDYCSSRYCKSTLSTRLQNAYAVFQLCRKDSICIWK